MNPQGPALFIRIHTAKVWDWSVSARQPRLIRQGSATMNATSPRPTAELAPAPVLGTLPVRSKSATCRPQTRGLRSAALASWSRRNLALLCDAILAFQHDSLNQSLHPLPQPPSLSPPPHHQSRSARFLTSYREEAR